MPVPDRDREARREGHLPAWLLERMAFEPEATPAGDGHHQHHQACESCRATVEALRRERDAFLASRPARPFLAGLAAAETPSVPERPASRSAWRWLFTGGLAAAGAAAVAIALWPAPGNEIRFKGEATFTLFVSRGGEAARPLETGETLRPGDLLRFGVVSPTPAHALVASIDEGGRVSRYHPPTGSGGAPVEGRAQLQVLPGSVELDETVGREWIVLVLSPGPLDGRRVEEALRKAWRERTGDRLGPVALEAQVRVVAVTKVRP
ncbi:MAG TPA: hypothetical protein VFR85_01480 [Anaeromyxobacteraceae bacterium]|nr:hypothetical protein [Anaeromyxobacteraceae bacterium]